LQDRLAEYSEWLASPAAIEELRRDGNRNPEKYRSLLDAIWQCTKPGGALRVTPGYRYLAEKTTVPLGAVGRMLARLFAAGRIELYPGADGEPLGVELVFRYVNTSPAVGDTVHIAKNWNWSDYRSHRQDDYFINNHHAYIITHPNATLPPLGDNGLPALLLLQQGPQTLPDLVDETGHTYGAMAATMRRYVAHGLVTVTAGARNRKTYSLAPNAAAILQANRPHITTYGVLLFRRNRNLRARITWLEQNGETEKADKLRPIYERSVTLEQKVREEAGIVRYERPPRQRPSGPPPSAAERAARTAWRDAYLAERDRRRKEYAREGERWRRKEYAKSRAAAERDWAEFAAWAAIQYGQGWWVHLDQTAIIGKYKIFEMLRGHTPNMHWDGARP